MSRHTSTHHSLSESEGFSHIESYYQSGLRPSAYYKQHQLSEHQFYNWRRRYLAAHCGLNERQSRASQAKKQFHEIKIEPSPTRSSPLSGLEIHYPHGVKVVIPAGNKLDIETFCSLVNLWE